jgi:UDP-N-acetylmuramyl pentapeptide phosphotransferase/UDP-N-acetylglucosamine-1-phosphate transferase
VSNIFGGIIDLSEYFVVFDFFGNILTIYYIPICMTIAWYVLVLNSVNFSDGIPGLTGGFALISFVILAGLAIRLYATDTTLASQENSQFLLILLAICIPATYVLTRADISRSAIMGDSGTIMLAFLIATFAIIGGGKIATAVSVLGIYLIDLVYVVTMRISEGKNPMK